MAYILFTALYLRTLFTQSYQLFFYAFFIYGILLRRASMTCKNINICEL